MDRFSLTDGQWKKMQPFGLGKPSDPGRTGGDGRLFVEAVLWIARTGSPWRDLPAFFGNWNTVFKRFRDWVKADVFKRMFDAVSDEPDMEYAMPGYRQISRRPDDQNPGVDRCVGQPRAVRADAGPTV